MPERPPYLSIALISAASIAYEILLMRLFSIIQWHHFAFMIIALALLGYGVSGTLIAIHRDQWLGRYRGLFCASLGLFGVSSVACFLGAQAIPFNAEEILWDSHQSLYLLSIFLLITVPFLFAASAICLTFMRYPEQVSRIYSVDLLGAGSGSLGMVGLLFVVFPLTALWAVGILGMVTFFVACCELQFRHRRWLGVVTLLLCVTGLIAGQTLTLNRSPYKGLEQTLRTRGTQIIEQRSSPLGLLSVVASEEIPFRYAPGLSLNTNHEPLPQLAVFTDGDNMTVITRKADRLEQLAYLDQMTSALPYHLNQAHRLLVIGAAGGLDVLLANYHGIKQIDAIELNPQMIDLVAHPFNDYAGALYRQDDIAIHTDEARDFLGRSQQRYDQIQIALLDAYSASASGLFALNESYLYTIEALQLYLKHLQPDGYLVITRWIKMPPRDTLKLFATGVDALRQSGIAHPEKQLLLIRSWQTSTLLIKNGVINETEIAAMQKFCDALSFDVAFTPTLKPAQVNRYNVLNEPAFYQAATALLGAERDAFITNYKFNLKPATDDQPYFHHFFKWSTLPEILRLTGQGGMPLLEWGYLVFIATLVIAVGVSIVLILLPLRFYQRHRTDHKVTIRQSQVVYFFFAIGLAFLFIEIAFMQKFILFLHHPIYAIAVILAAFLLFAGLGSHWSMRVSSDSQRRVNRLAVSGITLLSAVYLTGLESLFALLMATPVAIKIVLTLLLIAPLAFLMGMPFPLALSSLGRHAGELIPWAWGINGCASVISAVLATLLAIHLGFAVVIVLAVLLYISAIFVFPAPMKNSQKTAERC